MVHRWPMIFGFVLGTTALLLGLHNGSDAIEGWHLAARWTARVGFPIFILNYSASALGRLWYNDLTRSIWRDRRWWGLGFVACHTIHLYALVTYNRLIHNPLTFSAVFVGFSAYAVLYVMAATSNAGAMRALGRNWKRLHKFGIHWVWLVFMLTYFGRVFVPASRLDGIAGIAIGLSAMGLRIAAWLKGRNLAPSAA